MTNTLLAVPGMGITFEDVLSTIGGDEGTIAAAALAAKRKLFPAEDLLLAVFEQGLKDLLEARRGSWERTDAEIWAVSGNDRWPYAFVAICRHFDWEPNAVRAAIEQLRTHGAMPAPAAAVSEPIKGCG